MPKKDSTRTEPQSRRDRYDEADPRQRPNDAAGAEREPDAEAETTITDTDGQSGYAAGGGRVRGSGAWSGRATPATAGVGGAPGPSGGAFPTDEQTENVPAKRVAAKPATPRPRGGSTRARGKSAAS